MSPSVKSWLRDWTPPRIVEAVRASSSSGIKFDGPYADWEEARVASGGYDDSSILEKVRDAILKVKRGEAAYERDSITFPVVEYTWPLLASLMWAAASEGGRLSVLDFGGSLGSSYFQNRSFLDSLSDVRWGVVEQPHYVACGQECVADDRLHFFSTIEAGAQSIRPNLILFSSVLQYLPRYESIVADAGRTGAPFIIVDRTMVGGAAQGAIYVQRVPASIYSASYPCQVIPETSLVALLERSGYDLVADFDSLPFAALQRIGAHYKGYIFRARQH